MDGGSDGGVEDAPDSGVEVDAGVAAVYTPKDFELVRIMDELVQLAVARPR